MTAEKKPKESTVETLVTIDANESKTKQWNECISPRLTALHSWFLSDEWLKGVRPYLNAVMEQRQGHLEELKNEVKDDYFIKGQIAMLRQIMSLPSVIDNQIKQIEENQKRKPSGDAGY